MDVTATNATGCALRLYDIYVKILKKESRCGSNQFSRSDKLGLHMHAHVYAVTSDVCA